MWFIHEIERSLIAASPIGLQSSRCFLCDAIHSFLVFTVWCIFNYFWRRRHVIVGRPLRPIQYPSFFRCKYTKIDRDHFMGKQLLSAKQGWCGTFQIIFYVCVLKLNKLYSPTFLTSLILSYQQLFYQVFSFSGLTKFVSNISPF